MSGEQWGLVDGRTVCPLEATRAVGHEALALGAADARAEIRLGRAAEDALGLGSRVRVRVHSAWEGGGARRQ